MEQEERVTLSNYTGNSMNVCDKESAEEQLQQIKIQKRTDQNLRDEDAHLLKGMQMIIAGLTKNFDLQQDLMQECRLRLWKFQCEGAELRKTTSWYLQNCRFHVLHFLNAGRSLDSLKRATSNKRVTISIAADQPPLAKVNGEEDLFEDISARDIICTLKSHLKPRERKVLEYLADGWTLKDTSMKVGLSYPTALKSRRAIAEVIIKLGIAQPSRKGKNGNRQVSNRKKVKNSRNKKKINGVHRN